MAAKKRKHPSLKVYLTCPVGDKIPKREYKCTLEIRGHILNELFQEGFGTQMTPRKKEDFAFYVIHSLNDMLHENMDQCVDDAFQDYVKAESLNPTGVKRKK